MPVRYEASKTITGIDSARGLIAIAGGGDGRTAKIVRASVTQDGDTTGQQIKCCLQTTTGTVTGAGAADGQKHEPLCSATANFSPTYNITSEPSYGGNPIGLEGDNCQGGWFYTPDKPTFTLSTSMKIVVRLLTAPSPDLDLVVAIVWDEHG